jgi:isoleucyl-tRNA synthetase
VERRPGRELVGRRYRAPFDALGPGARVEHRVVAWQLVELGQGSGIVRRL